MKKKIKNKKNNEKAEKYYTNEGTNQKHRIQINEEEIDKRPEKEFRIKIVRMIKNLENKMEKMQESINKELEKLKNKHIETNNTITEIKNTLEESIAEYLKQKNESVTWKIKWWK